MTPLEVYNAISKYLGVSISNICDVRTQCLQYTTCSNKSTTPVLDFDKAAHTYQKAEGIKNTPQAVDAIAIDRLQTLLVLIEKKTWGQFFEYLPTSEKKNPLDAALEKVATYDLKGKYESTRSICEQITSNPYLFNELPHVFVFLTEFSDTDPMGGFPGMMSELAFTSSSVDYKIQRPVVDEMRKHLTTVPCMNSRYLNCMELDAFIADPSSFEK